MCFGCYDKDVSSKHNLYTSTIEVKILFLSYMIRPINPYYKRTRTFVERLIEETIQKKRKINCFRTEIMGREGFRQRTQRSYLKQPSVSNAFFNQTS